MRNKLLLGVASAALMIPGAAFAQSTGSIEFGEEIVVTGEQDTSVGGVEIPDTPKAKTVLTQEVIQRQRPGQTVNDIVNLSPGVSFQNNDPWGSSGGSFTIRGFDSSRISQTVDGIPLNDSGNYALYTNQQMDPETIEMVNVNLGSTDVDSPTASAVGGTINIRTRVPSDDFGIMSSFSYGNIVAKGSSWERPYFRAFGMVDTGDLTGMGTKAWFSASYTTYENPFNNYGEVEKKQFNGRIYQEIGANGDFVSVSGHYNENRNNFFGSQSYNAVKDYDREDRFYEIDYPCTVDLPTAGVADVDNNCGAEFDRRFNPSNTGNIRGSSRFTLSDGLILTVDPSFQYVKANGGGDEELLEGFRTIGGQQYTGFISGRYYYGRDLNGDGDMLDEVTGHDPSQTQTRRYGVIANLAYDLTPAHRVRLSYTFDRAYHRQTGQTSVALPNGDIADVFPVNDPLVTSDGFVLNKRDRKSFATLHQVSGEYRGRFFEDSLTLVLGLRAPFFTRDLDQRCYTTSASGYLDCIGGRDANYEANNPNAAIPQERTYKYDKLLPNVGFTYRFTPEMSVFASFTQGISVPGTDPLYNSLYFPAANDPRPAPELTDSFDAGFRYQSGNVQAQLAGWYTQYRDRLATAYDPLLDEVIYRNLDKVKKYGVDASVAIRPIPELLLYVFGSYLGSEIGEDIQAGTSCSSGDTARGICYVSGGFAYYTTGGKEESGSPNFTVGSRVQADLGDFSIGGQVKYTGKRWLNDVNDVRADGYTLVDIDLRYSLASLGLGESYLQLNVTNIFDTVYTGGFGGSFTDDSPYVQIGPPRAASISLITGF
ncbi:TonB-dependent receptor [Stakelama tenebrarum]|uniref:TonB-dependent receptor n=1 Tax=Stakelama tenebrarum TaxID=2711215 RepID=A0A6G6Y956_9SPHN|nr:TonB-dependent receptor [Sphingosinithalassobacter tenebrarum]QIG81337.1 TonB-dependent receptor [Sphingosinithalassobacter tenebrarum]